MGAAIAVITSLIVGFLTLPNNIMYLIDSSHATRLAISDEDSSTERRDYEYAYIHAGIALIVLGILARVVSVVLSIFTAKSKRKLDYVDEASYRSTRTVLACLTMMNLELFMAAIAGCMELLYRPLVRNDGRLHRMEMAIAVFNVIIYLMYVVTMVLTSVILREKAVTEQPADRRQVEVVNYSRDPRYDTRREHM